MRWGNVPTSTMCLLFLPYFVGATIFLSSASNEEASFVTSTHNVTFVAGTTGGKLCNIDGTGSIFLAAHHFQGARLWSSQFGNSDDSEVKGLVVNEKLLLLVTVARVYWFEIDRGTLVRTTHLQTHGLGSISVKSVSAGCGDHQVSLYVVGSVKVHSVTHAAIMTVSRAGSVTLSKTHDTGGNSLFWGVVADCRRSLMHVIGSCKGAQCGPMCADAAGYGQSHSTSSWDIWLLRGSLDGKLVSRCTVGSAGDDQPHSVALHNDGTGALLVSGTLEGFPLKTQAADTVQSSKPSSSPGAVAKPTTSAVTAVEHGVMPVRHTPGRRYLFLCQVDSPSPAAVANGTAAAAAIKISWFRQDSVVVDASPYHVFLPSKIVSLATDGPGADVGRPYGSGLLVLLVRPFKRASTLLLLSRHGDSLASRSIFGSTGAGTAPYQSALSTSDADCLDVWHARDPHQMRSVLLVAGFTTGDLGANTNAGKRDAFVTGLDPLSLTDLPISSTGSTRPARSSKPALLPLNLGRADVFNFEQAAYSMNEPNVSMQMFVLRVVRTEEGEGCADDAKVFVSAQSSNQELATGTSFPHVFTKELVFPPGLRNQTVQLFVFKDSIYESVNEVITLRLFSATRKGGRAIIGANGLARLTIINDDPNLCAPPAPQCQNDGECLLDVTAVGGLQKSGVGTKQYENSRSCQCVNGFSGEFCENAPGQTMNQVVEICLIAGGCILVLACMFQCRKFGGICCFSIKAYVETAADRVRERRREAAEGTDGWTGASPDEISANSTVVPFSKQKTQSCKDQGKGKVAKNRVAPVKEGGNDDNAKDDHCSICLMDFEEGENLRMLPCLHSFHVKCVDQWLSQNNVCPVCKHAV